MKFSKRRRRYLKKRIGILRGHGLSWKQVANKLGISESSVYRLRQPNENAVVLYPKGNARASASSKEIAIRYRGAGLTVACVAWVFRVSTRTIYRWCRSESNDEWRVQGV